jgi:hypothetical protein
LKHFLLLILIISLFASPLVTAKTKKKTKIKHTNKKQTNTPMYSLRLGIDEGKEESTMSDLDKLLAFAKTEKIATPLQILMRTAHQKLTRALKDRIKRDKRAAERKAAQEKKFGKERNVGNNNDKKDVDVKFTTGQRQSRELKAKAPKCNMKEYLSKSDLEKAFKDGTVNLDDPFIVRNSIDNFKEMQKEWTSDELKGQKYKSIGINYYEPKMARVMMQQGGQAKLAGKDEEGGQAMEVFDPQIVSFTEFFAKCFSKNKRPGPDTEHCEQEINALLLNRKKMGQYRLTAFKAVGYRQDMESDLFQRLYTSVDDGSLLKLFNNQEKKLNEFVQSMEKQSSRNIVFGPSGSGSSMRQEGMPFVDGLVHGRRRWFIMTPQAYTKLKKLAGDDFTPGSAFSFFEDMYAELKEEFDMSIGVEHGIYECNQGPNDIVYIPAGVVRTSLTLSDSISYKQDVLLNMNQVYQLSNQLVWQPMRQQWNGAMCYSPVEKWGKIKKKSLTQNKLSTMTNSEMMEMAKNIHTKLGGLERIGLDPGQLVQAFSQQIQSKNSKMAMLLPTVFTCQSVNSLQKNSPSSSTTIDISDSNTEKTFNICNNIGHDCNEKLFEHAKALNTQIVWLGNNKDSNAKKEL